MPKLLKQITSKIFSWRLVIVGFTVAFLSTVLHETGHVIPALFFGGRFRFAGLDEVYVLASRNCSLSNTCLLQNFLSDAGGPLVSLAIISISLMGFLRTKKLEWLSGLYFTNYFLASFLGVLTHDIGGDLNKISEILNVNPVAFTGFFALLSLFILGLCTTKINKEECLSTIVSYLLSALIFVSLCDLSRKLFYISPADLSAWMTAP